MTTERGGEGMRAVPEDAAVPIPSREPGLDQDDPPRSPEAEPVQGSERVQVAPRRRTWRAGRIASAAPLAGVLLLGLLLVMLFIRAYEPLSPLDEMQHMDYVNHVLAGDPVVVLGDTIEPETQRAVACRGIDLPWQPPPCGGPYTTSDFPNQGFNSAYIHAPVYYGITAAWVWAWDHVPLPGDDVSLMRSSGVIWVVATILLMWAMLRSLELSRMQRVSGCLLALASPTVVLALGTVTNDATALAVGAAVTWAVVRWDQGRTRLWLVVLLCALAVLLKATNVGVVGLAVVYVAARAWQRSRAAGWGPNRNRALVLVAAIVGGAGIAALGWTLFQKSAATIAPSDIEQNAAYLAPHFDVSWLFEALPTFLTPLEAAFPMPLRGAVVVSSGTLVSVALVVLFVLGVASRQRTPEIGALAVATATALLGLGPLLVILNYVGGGIHVGIPIRYGLSLVPAVIAVGVSAARGPRQRWALLAFAAVCCLLLLRRLLLA
jgi:hypothetical protein